MQVEGQLEAEACEVQHENTQACVQRKGAEGQSTVAMVHGSVGLLVLPVVERSNSGSQQQERLADSRRQVQGAGRNSMKRCELGACEQAGRYCRHTEWQRGSKVAAKWCMAS